MVIDATAILILALFVLFGTLSGLMSQLIGLAAAVLTALIGPPIAMLLRPYVADFIGSTQPTVVAGVALIVAVIGTFLTLWITLRLAAYLLRKSHPAVETTDRTFGGVLGFVKGAILVIVVAEGVILIAEKSPTINDTVESVADDSVVLKAVDAIRWTDPDTYGLEALPDMSTISGALAVPGHE